MLRTILTAATLAVLGGPAIAWEDCRASAERHAEVDAAGVDRVEIVASAGELEVVGAAAAKAVRARGEACAEDDEYLPNVDLRVERTGTTVRVVATIPRDIDASLDFDVEVPEGVRVELVDTSGELRVEHVAALELRDSSGDIHVDDVDGPVAVEDSSGEIDLSSVGDLHIVSDSSGDIRIRRARSVRIDVDSSGDIFARDVAGDVSIGSDSSGSIEARAIGGDFSVENDGSGGIEYSEVAGRVQLPTKY